MLFLIETYDNVVFAVTCSAVPEVHAHASLIYLSWQIAGLCAQLQLCLQVHAGQRIEADSSWNLFRHEVAETAVSHLMFPLQAN
jgi:hypothetical protein